MKPVLFLLTVILIFSGCHPNNNLQVQKLKELAGKDSSMLAMGSKEDSEMTSCLSKMNEIGNNLERVTFSEDSVILLSSDINPANRNLLATELNRLDKLIINTAKKINLLENRLKNSTVKNADMDSLAAHLVREMEVKKDEAVSLLVKLCKTNTSLQPFINRLNDSMPEINKQRSEEVMMKEGMNTCYFASGTIKDLQHKGIINKEGQFSRGRKAYETNSGLDNSSYIKTDLTNLKGLELTGKFFGLITVHPSSSYKVIPSGRNDSIAIINPFAFWCESKYLVVAVK